MIPIGAAAACPRRVVFAKGARVVEAEPSVHVKRAALPTGPMLPAARAGALSMIQDEDVRMDDLAGLIRADPGLSLVLLRAANSAASAPRSRIEDTRDALVRIGLQATKQVLAAAVVGEAFRDVSECGLDEDAFWAHSLAVAVIAESSVTTPRLPPIAFSAGMLHDVGRLVLGASIPGVYETLSQKARTAPMVLGAETALFGEDHAKAGGRLLSMWGVSEEIAATVARHHEPASGELEEALLLARHVVAYLGYDDGLRCHFEEPPVEVEVPKGITAPVLRQKVAWYQSACITAKNGTQATALWTAS